MIRALVWALLLAAVVAAPARAQDRVAPARSAYFEVDFARARSLLDALIADPAATRSELAQAYALRATIESTMAEGDAARADLDAAVWLDPRVAAPEGAPPEVVAELDVVRRSHGALSVTLVMPERLSARERAEVRAAAVGDPIASLSLSCAAGAQHWASDHASAPLDVELEEAGTLACDAVARARSGAVLDSVHGEVVAEPAAEEVVVVAPRPDPLPHEDHTPRSQTPVDPLALGLGIGGAVLAVAALGIGLGVALSPATTSDVGLIRIVGF